MITIRKKIRKSKITLYLDIYSNGKRNWENTNLYLTGNKQEDKIIMREAERLKAKRYSEILDNNGNIGYLLGKKDFIDYSEMIFNEKPEYLRRVNVLKALKLFKEKLPFEDINESFYNEFIRFLKKVKNYKDTTIFHAISIIKSVLNRAVRDGIIRKNPLANIKNRRPKTNRHFLDIEELKILSKTPCINETVKNAFLFSCYTGLRLSDVKNLKRENITNNCIIIKQQKTNEPVMIPLSSTALYYLENSTHNNDFIFDLPAKSTISIMIKQWALSAGIKKHITYHCSRHTFATLSLTFNVDIATVSKLLGHTDLKTTLIYAKIVDEKKVQAVNLIPSVLME